MKVPTGTIEVISDEVMGYRKVAFTFDASGLAGGYLDAQ